jgi:alkylation response protein AidB-like acyl-CoA dehydrogenase
MTDAFTDEQTQFAGLAAKVFSAATRDTLALDDGSAGAIRAELAEIGLPLLAVAEDLGGGGMTEIDVVLILEEAGYADVPVPIAETVGVVAPMVARYGTAEQRQRWLPALASGHSLGTTVCPGTGLGSRRGAGLALVEHDGRVHLVDLGLVDYGRLWSSPGEMLAAAGAPCLAEPPLSVAELRFRGAWVTAALLNGVSRRLLDLSLDHARTREQFGVAIGSFQAVKHMLADMAACVESARPTAWSAARTLAADDPRSGLAAGVAKAVAGRAGALANDHAMQIHGAIGFTREHALRRWLLFGHELESRWGTAAEHHAALGRFALAGASLIDAFAP